MTERKPIRVLLVDDSPTAIAVLKKLLATSGEIDVVGTAKNGVEALDRVLALDPAVICTDLEMPVMGGLELTKKVMASCPKPILVISSFVQKEDVRNIFRVLEAGAIDVFPKPRGGVEDGQMNAAELVGKIKVLSGVKAVRRRARASDGSKPAAYAATAVKSSIRIVVVGASTGGPQALATVLGPLPTNFPVPILCVQHIGAGFLDGLMDWLRTNLSLAVGVAQSGELPEPGKVYFPQERTHLTVDSHGRLACVSAPPVGGHCPSINVTLKSVAEYFGSAGAGILLTGMGDDGAEGLKALADAGGLTIAQDEKTSVVFGMPARAIALGAAGAVLPLDRIAENLMAEFR
jgi:two-component system, chemotaxis family, protein-glutamate methylesterase/glutaminase